MNDIADDEITGYVAQVRAALGGVPESTREELLDDLPEHLAEVLAEGNGTLTGRLGAPSAYAAELLAAAGLAGGPPKRRDQLRDLRERGARWLRIADVRVGPVLGYARASEFLVLLRPAWWVLRGYLAAMVIAQLLDSGSAPIGLLPRIGGSDLVALVLLAAAVVGSIWLGRRGAPVRFWPRYAYWSATAVVVIFALAGFSWADSGARTAPYLDATYSGGSGYGSVEDVFVYDGQGRPVENAQLYDQNGAPLQMGGMYCTDPVTGESRATWQRGYPHCPERNPFQSPSASPSPADPGVAPPGPSPAGSAPGAPAPIGTAPSGTAPNGAGPSSSAGVRTSATPSASPSR
ncbi:HAAS signaling domain-containing protein [Actinoplanes siamensis]|uniref:Uncharacterized protein n=1 Tax=Actinoplanes siamensis TaxID=1223317 RepID=A0A919TJZ7_9ACTN|nr:hypothetical protein [Actinoplanes siamensis]GIF05122.1 hypothetical protein Asi03nite_26600 [Actinoplanes siamensis]